MLIEYDAQKSQKNEYERDLSFSEAVEFDFETAFIQPDLRKNYGEERFQALGYIGERLHMLVFCYRDYALRIISFRKANAREQRKYENFRRTISRSLLR
nr:BrnT family toxin [Actinobacillus porcinus]